MHKSRVDDIDISLMFEFLARERMGLLRRFWRNTRWRGIIFAAGVVAGVGAIFLLVAVRSAKASVQFGAMLLIAALIGYMLRRSLLRWREFGQIFYRCSYFGLALLCAYLPVSPPHIKPFVFLALPPAAVLLFTMYFCIMSHPDTVVLSRRG